MLLEANQRLIEYLKNPAMPFHLWLRHLAQDRIIDTHRRHRQAQRRSIDREQAIQAPAWANESSVQLVAQLADAEQTPASAAIHQELQRRLNDALAELNEDDRETTSRCATMSSFRTRTSPSGRSQPRRPRRCAICGRCGNCAGCCCPRSYPMTYDQPGRTR